MKTEIDENAVRITQQFRSGDVMVYDFRSKLARMTLRVSGRGGTEGPPTEWRIEASTNTAPDAPVVVECGATRAAALQAVGDSWDRKRIANHLPAFDWESVARAMSAVRAI